MAAVAGMAAMELGGCEGLCICTWVPTCSKEGSYSCSSCTITYSFPGDLRSASDLHLHQDLHVPVFDTVAWLLGMP